jgi:hypothetical protein
MINIFFGFVGGCGVFFRNLYLQSCGGLSCCTVLAQFVMLIIGSIWRFSAAGQICSGEAGTTGGNYAVDAGEAMKVMLIIQYIFCGLAVLLGFCVCCCGAAIGMAAVSGGK